MMRLFGASGDIIPEIGLIRTSPLWKPDDPLAAKQQHELLKELDYPIQEPDTGFVVEGGSTIRLAYRSAMPLADLQQHIPNLTAILNMELFLCQVCLKRADVSNEKKAWVFSPSARFGAQGEHFPDRDIPLLKHKWATMGKN